MDIHDEIFAEPIITDDRLRKLHDLLTKILRASNKQTRARLLFLLERWRKRVLFIDALQTEKDKQDQGTAAE